MRRRNGAICSLLTRRLANSLHLLFFCHSRRESASAFHSAGCYSISSFIAQKLGGIFKGPREIQARILNPQRLQSSPKGNLTPEESGCDDPDQLQLQVVAVQSRKRGAAVRYVFFLPVVFLFGVAPFLPSVPAIQAQLTYPRIYGPADADVVTPAMTGPLGQYDPGALSEMIDHLKAVSGTTAWSDMQAMGEITYPGSAQTNAATLSILNIDRFRLDVTTPQGLTSTRIAGRMGAMQTASGNKLYLPEATAALGLIAFPRLRAMTFSDGNSSLIDDGLAMVGGKQLHRVTLVYPLYRPRTVVVTTAAANSAASPSPVKKLAEDLYFDPATHLLIKSVDVVLLPGPNNQRFVRCTTYGDYREVKGSQIPFQISQSLNGQMEWVLQLSSVSLGVGLKTATFVF
jgi:hypothetical protein